MIATKTEMIDKYLNANELRVPHDQEEISVTLNDGYVAFGVRICCTFKGQPIVLH